ncbi:MAG: hypothetical protein L0Y57_00725, partial [Beijerinckiaceae bacterium]|nr:hypothetical protein [Beijerinckiaceae bacterium]
YRVRTNGETSQAVLDGLKRGVTLEGVTYAGIEAVLDRTQGANCWLTMGLREGKNREIKRVLESIGLTVNRLIRISYGPFQLGDLAEGKVEEIRTRVLRDQLGPSLAKAAGADFTSPLQVGEKAVETPAIASSRARKATLAKRPPAPRQRPFEGPAEAKIRARGKPPPRRRKHVSALRAEYLEGTKTRTRIERGKTQDRAGRPVEVERLEHVGQEQKPALRPDTRQNRVRVDKDDSKKRYSDRMPDWSGETKKDKQRSKQPAKFAAHSARGPKARGGKGAPRPGGQPAVSPRGQRPRTSGSSKPRRPRSKS